MKILFITPSLSFGGAERVMTHLSNAFLRDNNSVSIIITDQEFEIAYELDETIDIRSIPIGRMNRIRHWIDMRRRLRREILSVDPDVIISFFNHTMTFVKLAVGHKYPLIFSERNDPNNNIKGFKAKIFQHIALSSANHIVFQSEGARSFYPKRVQRKSCIILNPLEIEKMPEREIDKVDNRIVSVGRLHPQKNQKMLINAFANSNAKDTHTLHIYGDGMLRDELSELITSLKMNDRIFLEGNSKQVNEDIKNSKLFVFTSDYEGLPNALMEAMIMGIPCISTDCSPGGARMLIDDKENGILIPCGDVDRLSSEIDNAVNGVYDLESIGNKAKLLAEKTNIDQIVNEWLENISKFKRN